MRTPRHRAMRWLGVLPALALIAAWHGQAAAQTATQAARTNDFLDIIGINGHIDANIGSYNNASGVVSDAQYLGLRHWRDGLDAQTSTELNVLKALANAGISLVGVPLQNQAITVSQHINFAHTWAALAPNALYALEGPNEPNNFPITFNGVSTGTAGHPTTFAPVSQFQSAYYAAVKADSVLQSLSMLSVTLGGDEPDNVGQQFLTIPSPAPSGETMPAATVFADFANIHEYPMYGGGAATITPSTDRIKQTYYNQFVNTYAKHFSGYTQSQADALPKVATEFGYPATGGTPGGVTTDIPTQGKDIITGLFNFWSEGYSRVHIYDLYDLGDGFGIFVNTGKPKASGTYIHNVTTVLADTGATAATFTPGSLTYSFANLPTSGRSALFEKSNGNFELVVWNNVENWNFSAGTPLTVNPAQVTVNLGTAAGTINVYDPTVGATPVQSPTNANTVTVSLADYPQIIEIVPAPPPSPPTASLAATPTTLTTGQSVVLNWASQHASACTGGGFSTGGAASGSAAATPSSSTTYSVSCNGAGGQASATASVNLTVPPAPTASLTATASSVHAGGSVNLSWNSTNATGCIGVGFRTGNTPSGSVTVIPSKTTNFTVVCSGAGGHANSVTIVTVGKK